MRIENLPDYARYCKFIVARNCDGALWFWGAYDDAKTARRAAFEIDGEVIAQDSIIF